MASTRERILSAAEDVVLTDGVACLTLEKAAVRAGLSKGGILYHFKTRADLVSAMVERLAERFDESVRAHHQAALDESAAGQPAGQPAGQSAGQPAGRAGAFTRAYVQECLAESLTEQERRQERVGAAVIAAVASEPRLLQPLRDAFHRWQAQIEDDAPDPVRSTVLRFAVDGLWLCELFGIDGLTPQMRADVRDEILRMVN